MSLTAVLFWLIATATAASAIGVVLSRSVVRATVQLLFTLIGVSLLYFLLGSEFLGAAQLIIYVGGTLVLVVFGVMLTSSGPFETRGPSRIDWISGGLTATALFLVLTGVIARSSFATSTDGRELPGTGAIGLTFLGVPDPATGTSYLLPFEIVSIHLLVVLIAAAYLARAKRRAPEAS